MDSIGWLTEQISAAGHVFVLTGAGMSTASGIPDFRGGNTRLGRSPKTARLFESENHWRKSEVRVAAWQFWLAGAMADVRPNAGHLAIASWQAPGRRVTIATQNVDGLHQRGGSGEVLELHGTFSSTRCLSCGDRRPISEAFDRVRAGEEDPHCRECSGLIRAAVVGFGQGLDPEVLGAARTAAQTADLAVVIGSSLQVQPAASLCSVAVDAGVPLAIINAEPTPYDRTATVTIRGDIPTALSRIKVS